MPEVNVTAPPGWDDYEEDVFDSAILLSRGPGPARQEAPFVQRQHSRSQIRAPQGYALLQATDRQSFTEQGGAVVLSRNWAATAAHCLAKIEDGKPVRFWDKLTLSLGCEDRDIQEVIFSCNEAWVHSRYQEYRGGFANDVGLIYSPVPFPERFVMAARSSDSYRQVPGELVSAPNMGSSGTAGSPLDGELHQFLHEDVMRVTATNQVYQDLEPVNGIVRPGASGGPVWDADGADKGALAGIVSHVDPNRLRATLMPGRELLIWAFRAIARREVAWQMGKLRAIG